jgi:hypothetical protein
MWNQTTVSLFANGTVWASYANPNWLTNSYGNGNPMIPFDQIEVLDGGNLDSSTPASTTWEIDWQQIWSWNG